MPRLFVSVDLPERLADEFAAVQAPLRDLESLRFTDPTQAHCTLQFLGDTDESRVDDVVAALERAVDEAERRDDGGQRPGDDGGFGPFEAEVGGLGVFPSSEYITVLWAGVRDGSAALTSLAHAVERETTALGFEPSEHDFTPHFTLARMDDARGKDRVRAYHEEDPTVGRFEVHAVRLTESTLTDDGPEYETRAVVPL